MGVGRHIFVQHARCHAHRMYFAAFARAAALLCLFYGPGTCFAPSSAPAVAPACVPARCMRHLRRERESSLGVAHHHHPGSCTRRVGHPARVPVPPLGSRVRTLDRATLDRRLCSRAWSAPVSVGGQVRIYDVGACVLCGSIAAHARWINALEVHPAREDLFATASEDTTIGVWRCLPDAKVMHVAHVPVTDWLLAGVAFVGANGSHLAGSAYDQAAIQAWKVDSL